MDAKSLWEDHICVVQSVGVSEFCVDSSHASSSESTLIWEIVVKKGWDVETAEVPDDVEDVVEDCANDIVWTKD